MKASLEIHRGVLPFLHNVLGKIGTRLGRLKVSIPNLGGSRVEHDLSDNKHNLRWIGLSTFALGALLTISPETSRADESGVSFWLPGQVSSLPAVPQVPGWSMAEVYYHTTVSA